MRRACLPLLSLLLAPACAAPADSGGAAAPVDTAAAMAAVEDVWSRWVTADTAGDADAFVALFAEGAQADLMGGPPLMGRAAIDSLVRGMFTARDYTSMDMQIATTYVESADLVNQGGSYVETYVEGGRTMTEYGRFVSSIMRQPDGQWRVMYVMAFADSTTPAR